MLSGDRSDIVPTTITSCSVGQTVGLPQNSPTESLELSAYTDWPHPSYKGLKPF